jgi:hypothetical protein
MTWKTRLAVLAAAAALGTSGCGNPCGALADRTCEKAGEDAPLCKEARKRAETAGSTERATCERALRIYEAATAE